MRTARWALALALGAATGPGRAQAPAGSSTPAPSPSQGPVTPSAASPEDERGRGAPAATPIPRPAPASTSQRKAQQAEDAGKAGDWRAALFAWQEAVNLDPRNAGYRMRLGEAYEKLSHWGEAVQEYELAAALEPPGEEALRRAERARAARDGKPPPQEAARASASTPAAPAYEAGVALIGRGQYAEALASLDEAVRKDPGLSVAYSARASALFGLGRYVDSAADYRTALGLDPSRATPLFGLAECNRLLGQGVAAVDYYARYVASTASDVREDLRAEARKRLGELRR
jgi:tetratricopeptide (TPR) repeat protein